MKKEKTKKKVMNKQIEQPIETPMEEMQNQNQIEQTQMNYLPDESPEYDKIEELKTEVETTEVETEPPKKKRGRKPKSETTTIENIPLIDLSPVLDIAIKRLPNPLPLTDLEKTLFNDTANKVFQKYGGGFKYIEEVNLSLVLLSIVYPRLKKDSDEKA